MTSYHAFVVSSAYKAISSSHKKRLQPVERLTGPARLCERSTKHQTYLRFVLIPTSNNEVWLFQKMCLLSPSFSPIAKRSRISSKRIWRMKCSMTRSDNCLSEWKNE